MNNKEFLNELILIFNEIQDGFLKNRAMIKKHISKIKLISLKFGDNIGSPSNNNLPINDDIIEIIKSYIDIFNICTNCKKLNINEEDLDKYIQNNYNNCLKELDLSFIGSSFLKNILQIVF